jgi:hypothetical protein
MVERTYHKVLSAVVDELLYPFFSVFTPHVHLHKKNSIGFGSCPRVIAYKLHIFINNNKLIKDRCD